MILPIRLGSARVLVRIRSASKTCVRDRRGHDGGGRETRCRCTPRVDDVVRADLTKFIYSMTLYTYMETVGIVACTEMVDSAVEA